MKWYLWGLLIILLIWIILSILVQLRRKTVSELNNVLYVNKNIKLYLSLLENPRLKLLFPQSTIENFRLDGLLFTNDEAEIKKQFSKLDRENMSKGVAIDYQTKKLSYFAKLGDAEQSKQAVDYLIKNLSGTKNKHNSEILEEANRIYEIYILKNIELIDTLKNQAENQNGKMKGITLFRIAKLYYFKQEENEAKKYLLKAQPICKNTDHEEIINDCLKDLSLLNQY